MAVRKRIRRHAPATQNDNTGVLPELSRGVIVREIPINDSPIVSTKLPFQAFEENVRTNSVPVAHGDDLYRYTYSGPLDPVTISTIGNKIESSLKAVVPSSTDMVQHLSSSFSSFEMHLFPTSLHRNVLFSVANNFAGMAMVPKKLVIEFLQRMTSQQVLRGMFSTQDFYTTRAITLNIFRASIEVGNAGLVEFFLNQSLPGIDVNKLICIHDDVLLTPVERAANLWHINVVKVLIAHGANVNLSDRRRKYIHGALDYAIWTTCSSGRSTGTSRISTLDPILVDMLLDAGASLSTKNLDILITMDLRGEFARMMIPRYIFEHLQRWCEDGTFFEILVPLGPLEFQEIVMLMIDNQVDANLAVPPDSDGFYREQRTLIDAVSYRGHLNLVRGLIQVGAVLADDTLACAVDSGNSTLVEYLLTKGSDVHRMASYGTSPLAAAIRCSDLITRQLIFERHNFENLKAKAFFESALNAAIEIGEKDWIARLMTIVVDVVPQDLGRALALATKYGSRDLSLSLVEAGVDTTCKPHIFCGPPIVDASAQGDTGLVHALLDVDVDPNLPNDVGETSLYFAIKTGNHALARDLTRVGADVNRIVQGEPLLNVAISRKDTEMIDLLRDAGSDINHAQTRTVMHYRTRPKVSVGKLQSFFTTLLAAVNTRDLEVVRQILQYGADSDDALAFAEANLAKDPAIMHLLLKQHIDKRSRPKGLPQSGGEVLKAVIDRYLQDDFHALLDKGINANIFYRDMKNFLYELNKHRSTGSTGVETTPFGHAIAQPDGSRLHLSKFCCNAEKRLIVSLRASCRVSAAVVLKNLVSQVTAFLAAIGSGHVETVELLLRYEADVNFPARLGVKRTPLQRAVEVGNQKIVQLLLDRGANVNAPAAQRNGGTALQFAAIQGFIPIARLLLDHGAALDAPGSKFNGRTSVEGAAEHGRLDMVFLLLEAGACLHGKDQAQLERARELAERNSHPYIADLLADYMSTGKLDVRDSFHRFIDLEEFT